MKIAHFVYGQYRQLDTAVKSWEFLNKFECDTYVSTWDKSIQISNKLDIIDDFNVTEEMVKNCLPNSVVFVSNEYEYDLNTHGNYDPRNHPRNSEKTYYHWRKCLELLNNSGKEYDLIILNRTDNYFFPYKSYDELFNVNDNKNIYKHFTDTRGIFLNDQNNYTVNDIFFIGEFNLMCNIINNLPKIETLLHDDFAKYLMSINIGVKWIDGLDISTLRPNMVKFKENELTKENILKTAKEWA
jgi:hypothetical protein